MKIPGFDFGQLGGLQNAMQEAQRKQEEMRQSLENERITASVGGGMVMVTMNGLKHLIAVKIDPSLLKEGDSEMLQDLIVAAVHEGERRAEDTAKQHVRNMLGGIDPESLGMKFPGMM